MREDYTFEKLISREELAAKVQELGAIVSKDYADKDTVFVGILKGCFVFMSDLIRAVTLDRLELGFMQVSTYGDSTVSSGNVVIKKDLDVDLTGRHVLIVEDIIDSGRTLSYLKKYFAGRGAASVKICTILDKPSRREAPLTPDYCGFTIPDAFVVGYGLDYAEHFRELPDLCILHGVTKEN